MVSLRRTKRGYVASTRFRELIGAYRRVTAGAATAAGAENKLKEKIAAGLPSQTEGDLGERLTAPWTLVGRQMVLLHALEHGQVPPQVSQGGDVVADTDVRAQRSAIKQVVAQLESMGFELIGTRHRAAAGPRFNSLRAAASRRQGRTRRPSRPRGSR